MGSAMVLRARHPRRRPRPRPSRLPVLAIPLAFLAAPQAPEAPPEAPPDPAPIALPAEDLPRSIPSGVEEMLELEERIREVAEVVLPATVALRVGFNQGSGVIVSGDGIVLTAAHVTGRPGQPALVWLADGRRVRGRTLGVNYLLDSAMVRITDEGDYPFVRLGGAREIALGEWVLATGHRGGYDPAAPRPPALRMGRIQGTSGRWLRTDCTIINGDSGGPLFDLGGRLIGVHSRIQYGWSANFHVPMRTYRQSWDRLLAGESWGGRGWESPHLGVEGRLGEGGYRIARVLEDTPAARVGLRAGDVIQTLNGEVIAGHWDLGDLISDHRPGDELVLEVLREGQPAVLRPELAARR